jgi:hypothetical protein
VLAATKTHLLYLTENPTSILAINPAGTVIITGVTVVYYYNISSALESVKLVVTVLNVNSCISRYNAFRYSLVW